MNMKYNLAAIAVASMALGATADALAKKPGGPEPAFPTVKELGCFAACEIPSWDAYGLEEFLPQPGVCDAEGDFIAVAWWADTIGAGEADGASQYAGDLKMEFVFQANCGFGEYVNSAWTEGTGTFGLRQFEFHLDLSTAESNCDGVFCYGEWAGLSGQENGLDDAYLAAHDKACADEGGWSVMDGEFAFPPGYEDFEVSLKHTAPGNAGRQDHPVVTADCYDFSGNEPD